MDVLRVGANILIGEDELDERFVRSSGPGGQNVNKVATAVQLRFDVVRSPSLPEDVRRRLMQQQRNRINADGVLILEAQEFRQRERNRQAARERLVELIERATKKPKPRKATKPTRASKERRLSEKAKRSSTKQRRGRVKDDE